MTEQQEKFSQILAEDISEEIKKALPSYSGTPYRLETAEIKKVFEMECPDYETLENDFEVWNELEKISKRSDVLYIVKDCLKKFNIECNDAQFNSFKKETLITMFFNVFDVFPKLNPEIKDGTSNYSDEKPQDDDTKIFEQNKDKIFSDEIEEKIKIDYADIENFLPEKITISNSAALRQFMTEFKNGKKIKEFFKQCCEKFDVELNTKKFDLLTKETYVPLFFGLFDIKFPESEKNAESPATSQPSAPEQIKPIEQVEKMEPLSFEQIKKIYDSAEKVYPESYGGFDVCNTLKIFENMPVTLFDHFWVKVPENCPIFFGCAALINATTNEVTASGSIENNIGNGNEILPHLIFDSKKIDYEQFKYGREYNVMLIPAECEKFFTDGANIGEYSGKIYLLECDIDFGELTTTTQPLCIDFGTSNTTAGTYGLNSDSDEIQLVKFRDVTAKKFVETEMLPTIVLVDSFENENPVYKFGYEAKKEIIDADYNTKASVFYEIKRWINSTDQIEEKLFDKNGKTIPKKFKHTDILKSYLEYVIATAEQQFKVKFKRLHFTAPVKLKSHFLSIVNNLFPAPEYSIEKEETSLDEGVAVVYHHISKLVSDEKSKTKSGDILILDCGGGTTDLASCHFEIKDSNLISRVLDIKTGFENGESNFGGNNVTFRILQMLKIKIFAHLQRLGNLTMDTLITEDENEILSKIDESYENKNKIYKNFVAKYEEAEKLIPTKFAKYDGRIEKYRVKRNYYYLWQMAEMIKIEFYRSNLVVNVDFDKEKDRKIYVDDLSKYYLYVRNEEDNSLKEHANPMDKVEITIKEINRIICPDIYALLNTLLNQYSGDRMETLNKLNKYSYRLSGQSCKISLFHDLLKEFIPGVLIRTHNSKTASQANEESIRLKKSCIEGSIKYMRDKAQGKIKPIQNTATPKNIYDVFMDDKCILSHDGTIEVIKGSNTMREITLTVKDSNGQKKRSRIDYKFHSDQKEFNQNNNIEKIGKEIGAMTPLSAEEINIKILNSLRAVNLDKDNAGASIYCIFTVPACDGYGFYIWEIIISKDKNGNKIYFIHTPQFETFEEETLNTFFNGDR